MSTKSDDVESRLDTILNETWDIRDGTVLPKTKDVALKNGAVRMDATFLYSDLAGSTSLQKSYNDTFAAKALRMYLTGSTTLIRYFGGSIKSFDGDRVMGVFVGKSMRNDAVKAAYAINWMVKQVIEPKVEARQKANETTSIWVPKHGIGVDTGKVFVTRAGIHNKVGEHSHNDLIFVGRAPNIAAKLSSDRSTLSSIAITKDVYSVLNPEQRKRNSGEETIWPSGKVETVGPYSLTIYRTDYWRRPSERV